MHAPPHRLKLQATGTGTAWTIRDRTDCNANTSKLTLSRSHGRQDTRRTRRSSAGCPHACPPQDLLQLMILKTASQRGTRPRQAARPQVVLACVLAQIGHAHAVLLAPAHAVALARARAPAGRHVAPRLAARHWQPARRVLYQEVHRGFEPVPQPMRPHIAQEQQALITPRACATRRQTLSQRTRGLRAADGSKEPSSNLPGCSAHTCSALLRPSACSSCLHAVQGQQSPDTRVETEVRALLKDLNLYMCGEVARHPRLAGARARPPSRALAAAAAPCACGTGCPSGCAARAGGGQH